MARLTDTLDDIDVLGKMDPASAFLPLAGTKLKKLSVNLGAPGPLCTAVAGQTPLTWRRKVGLSGKGKSQDAYPLSPLHVQWAMQVLLAPRVFGVERRPLHL